MIFKISHFFCKGLHWLQFRRQFRQNALAWLADLLALVGQAMGYIKPYLGNKINARISDKFGENTVMLSEIMMLLFVYSSGLPCPIIIFFVMVITCMHPANTQLLSPRPPYKDAILPVSVAYRYRKSISIIELFVSIYIDIYRVLSNYFWRSLSKFTGWAIIEELSIRRRIRRFLSSWGQKARVKHYNIDLSSWYEFWLALISIDMNVISALSTRNPTI